VEGWTGLAIRPMTVDDEPVMAMSAMERPDPPELTLASGELPTGPDEVALGSRTAEAVGAEIGDRVVLAGDPLTEPKEVVVTGIAVLPALGPYLSDRAAPGAGALISPAVLGTEVVDEIFTFVGIDLADGASPEGVLDAIRGDFPTWALFGDAAYDYADPVRPPEIIDAASMRTVPVLVGALLAVAAAAGLLFAAVVSVQSRRRELGTLRALGFTGRQLRTSVRVQTLATMASALALGIPIGLVVGRVAWRSFASELGVVTEPSMPWAWLALTVAGGLAVALAAAAVPARSAARAGAAAILRSE
jgi:putative ABC transport system permease protein